MLVNLNQTYPLIAFTGKLPAYSVYKVDFVSKYSNKSIFTFGSKLAVRIITQGKNWSWFQSITPIGNIETNELDVYFDCILYGYDSEDREYEISKTLCKVNNDHLQENPDNTYISDNEDNEQFIYYNNE